jgi:hypothetical protein
MLMNINSQENTMFIFNNKHRGDWQIYKNTIESIESKWGLTYQNLRCQGNLQGRKKCPKSADAIESEE